MNYRSIFRNSIYFSIINVTNMASPIVAIPLIVNAIGMQNFGILAIYAAQFAVFSSIVDYGFNISAVQQAVARRHDREEIARISSTIISIRICISILICLGTLAFTIGSNLEADVKTLLILFNLGLIPQAINVIWLFQINENMKPFMIITLISRLAYILIIVLLVREPQDKFLIPIANLVALCIIGLLGVFYVKIANLCDFKSPRREYVLGLLKEAAPYFATNLITGLYLKIPIFILGAMSSATIVAQYSLAERLVNAFKAILSSLNQASLVQFSAFVAIAPGKSLELIPKSLIIIALPLFIIGSITFIALPRVLNWLLSYPTELASTFAKILVFSIPLTFLSFISCIVIMGGLKLRKELIILYGGILPVSATLVYILSNEFGYIAVPYVMILSEALVLITSIGIIRRRLSLDVKVNK